ncbi:uncharacterized protein LOC110850338 [Folsomia candida]|uniref:uncharacterized protein LOC110850338 n=1 Tax=Folsomia candida TaxID=158441 RepID=UPI000B8FD2A1|nr:uncharacterized protein LOC110850338 [Folsomia candida]
MLSNKLKISYFCILIFIPWTRSIKRLGGLNVNKKLVTLSGFSSGGTFAQQLYISHSSMFSGIGVFSHTFYRCGPGNGVLADYDATCTKTVDQRNPRPKVEYHPSNAVVDIHAYFYRGLIDNPYVHIARKPLYVFAGTKNYLFTTDMSLRILHVFKPFIKDKKAIRVRVEAANLTLPTNRKDLPGCSEPTNTIQISNCGFSGALDALTFILGHDLIRPPTADVKLNKLLEFDQTDFYGEDDDKRNDMDSVGYFYIPRVCYGNKVECLLHIYFHGCMTGREFVGPYHILNSGFLQVAEMNGIIMIFPQAVSSKENMIGCWDTFGVTGELYATREGAQVSVVKNMLDKILSKEFPNFGPPPRRRQQQSNAPSLSNIFKRFTTIPKFNVIIKK